MSRQALGELGDLRGVEVLLRVAEHHPDYHTKHNACEALGRLGGPRAVEALLRLAEHHYIACRALGRLGDFRAVEALLRVAEHHPYDFFRSGANAALQEVSRATGRRIQRARRWKRLLSLLRGVSLKIRRARWWTRLLSS